MKSLPTTDIKPYVAIQKLSPEQAIELARRQAHAIKLEQAKQLTTTQQEVHVLDAEQLQQVPTQSHIENLFVVNGDYVNGNKSQDTTSTWWHKVSERVHGHWEKADLMLVGFGILIFSGVFSFLIASVAYDLANKPNIERNAEVLIHGTTK